MNEFIKRANQRLADGDLSQDSWEPELLILEQAIVKFLDSFEYKQEEAGFDRTKILKESTDERLAYARELLTSVKKDKEKALIPGVKLAKDHMQEILDCYHIGNLHEFYLQDGGIYVEVWLHIRKSFSNEKETETEKIKFEYQLKKLRDLGMELQRVKYGSDSYEIRNTDNNRNILINLLESIGVNRIEMKSRKDSLWIVTGMLDPEKLVLFEIPKEKPSIDKAIYKEDQLIFIKNTLNKLYDSIATINQMPEMVSVCGTLIEHYFADICDTLGLITETSERVKNHHKAERIKNTEIRKIEEDIGKVLVGKELINVGKAYLNKIGLKAIQEIGFRLSNDSFVGPYQVLLKFSSVSMDTLIYSFELYDKTCTNEDEDMESLYDKTVKKFEETFHIIEPFDGEQYIAYTEKNMNILSAWVKRTFEKEMDSFEIDNKNGLYYIKSFSVYVNKL